MEFAHSIKAGAMAAAAMLTACGQGADTNAQANQTTAAAEAAAREMHNQMSANEEMGGDAISEKGGMNGMHDMDMGNMSGGNMSSMSSSTSNAAMPMEDDM
jgi:hypothetical protein